MKTFFKYLFVAIATIFGYQAYLSNRVEILKYIQIGNNNTIKVEETHPPIPSASPRPSASPETVEVKPTPIPSPTPAADSAKSNQQPEEETAQVERNRGEIRPSDISNTRTPKQTYAQHTRRRPRNSYSPAYMYDYDQPVAERECVCPVPSTEQEQYEEVGAPQQTTQQVGNTTITRTVRWYRIRRQ